jgi:phosphomannomutase
MRLTAPELARATARACRRGRHVSTPGMVGTEMLYYLVGSRELDGG